MTEKIRQLANKVHFAGPLVELNNVIEGKTKANIPYISFSGVIQCGPSQVNQVRFRTFVKSKKADGTDSKNFAAVKKWAKEAIPMSEDEKNPTYVDAIGSIVDHPYVNKENKLVESTEFNLQFFKPFDEYIADIDIEGFIHSIKDETKGADSEETTGRQKMRIISRDIFSNTLSLNNIVIPEELVDALADNGYERGSTAKFYISLVPNKKVTPAKTGGIGVQRVDGGKPYLEWMLTGADPVYEVDSEQSIDPKLVKAAMVERQSHLDEIKEAGYLGSKSGDSSPMASNSVKNSADAIKSQSKAEVILDDIGDDDFPF